MDDVELILTLFRSAGWWGVAAGAVMIMIRMFRKPGIQEQLPSRFRWDKLPPAWRLAFIVLSAAASCLVTALATGAAPAAALAATLPTTALAIVGHKATKAVGHKATPRNRKAGSIRTALDAVGALPLDHKTLYKKLQ